MGRPDGKNKKKKKRKDTSSDEELPPPPSESDDSGSEHVRAMHQVAMARKASRDGAISWNLMAMSSVRGKVSNDNQKMTDADLERRFGSHDHADSGKNLMSEEQVMAMMRKEK